MKAGQLSLAEQLIIAINCLQITSTPPAQDAFARLIESKDRKQAIIWYQNGAKKLHPESLLALQKAVSSYG